MPILELLSNNAKLYSNEVSLVEREPSIDSRREITWLEFENQANKIANALINYGVKRGDKVILLMNCLSGFLVTSNFKIGIDSAEFQIYSRGTGNV